MTNKYSIFFQFFFLNYRKHPKSLKIMRTVTHRVCACKLSRNGWLGLRFDIYCKYSISIVHVKYVTDFEHSQWISERIQSVRIQIERTKLSQKIPVLFLCNS